MDGKEYRFAQFGLSLGLKAAPEVRRLRKRMFDEAVQTAKELPVDVSKELVLEAFRDLASSHSITQRQAFEWLATPEGNLWQVRTSLQSVGKQMTDEDCETVFSRMTPAQWREFDDFQMEPFRNAMSDTQRLRSDLSRAMKALNSVITDEVCEATYQWLIGE